MGRATSKRIGFLGWAVMAAASTASVAVADRGAAARGVADRGVADRGVTDRGVADRGVADRGVTDRGVAESTREADGYITSIVVGTSYKAGEKASFNVTLQPKTGFHINGQFPIRFKANTPPEGVTYDKPLLKREDGKFTDTDGSFQVDFTAAKAGTYTVGGTISLSVCNEKTCTMEKVALEAAIEVK